MITNILDLLDEGADKRVRKTKRALREALISQIEIKPINLITVKEITAAADVNRSTFYLYYRDVTDMFEKVQDEIYAVFSTLIVPFDYDPKNIDSLAAYIALFLTFCKENEGVCRFIFRNEANNLIAHRIKQSIVNAAPDSHRHYPVSDPRHYMTTYALSGMIFCVEDWLSNGMKTDVDEFAQFLAEIYIHGSVFVKEKTK